MAAPRVLATRWLPYSSPATVGRGVGWHFLFLVCILGVGVALLSGGLRALASVVDRNDAVYARSTDQFVEEAATGPFRSRVELASPYCEVLRGEWRKGSKGKSVWRSLETRSLLATVVDARGMQLRVSWFDVGPYRRTFDEVSEKSLWASRAGLKSTEGVVRVWCLPEHTVGYLIGRYERTKSGVVVRGERMNAARMLVHSKTDQPLRDARAATLLWRVSLLAVPIFALLAAVVLACEGRPEIDVLGARAPSSAVPAETRRRVTLLWIVPLVALFLGMLIHLFAGWDRDEVARGSLVVPVAVATVLGYGVGRLARARHRIGAAMEPILRTRASELGHLMSSVVEVECTIASPEPLVQGPITNKPRAFFTTAVWRIRTHEVVTKKGSKTTVRTVSQQAAIPSHLSIAVTDPTGTAVLNIEHALLLTPARRKVYRRLPPALWQITVDELGLPKDGVTHHVIEEQYIEPGATLYVLGNVLDQTSDRSRASGPYRDVSLISTLGGSETTPLLVYVGKERGLIASLKRMRIACDVAVVSALGLYVGLAAIAGWLIAQ